MIIDQSINYIMCGDTSLSPVQPLPFIQQPHKFVFYFQTSFLSSAYHPDLLAQSIISILSSPFPSQYYQMLSKALQSILRRYFGEFITGLQNVQLTFWTGKINIQNASFKHDKINELLKLHNIPLSIKHSFLGSLEIDIPWNKLTSAPVEIKLGNVMIVLKLEKVVDAFKEQEDPRENGKLILIKNYLAYLLKKSEQAKAEQESESGFLKKLFIKILHNLNLEISNIHIRIENHNNTIIQANEEEDQFVDCKEESEMDLGFSLGFCIESIDVQTINANNVKEFVKVDNDKTEVRKRINMRQISLYWEESSSTNLFELSQDRKLEFLRYVIARKKHRLLTIDGQILMEKGKNGFDYFFSTSFRLLQIGLNYEQLKQFIQVYQQFMNAKTRKKITKLRQIQYGQQLKLQGDFKTLFAKLQACNFKEVGKSDIELLESVDKKLLMRWTKQQTIQGIKRSKLRQAFQNKNKKTWLGFLSKNTQNELSRQEITAIEKQVDKFVQLIDEESFGKTVGFYLHFQLLRLIMDHHRVQQQLLFSAENIQLQFEMKKGEIKAGLEISDIGLTYEDVLKQAKVKIIQNYQEQERGKYFTLRVQDNKQRQTVDIAINPMRITHEIQFLSFISELVRLRQRQKVKGQMAFISPQITAKSGQKSSNIQNTQKTEKLYECRIDMKRLEILVQLSKNTSLHAYIGGIKIDPYLQRNSHNAKITNLGIAYIQTAGDNSYNILDDLSIEVTLRQGLNLVQSCIPLLRITLNEESLYYIIHCMSQQYQIIKIRSFQSERQGIDEEKFMQGETSSISVFKTVNVYYCVLTAEHLYFYSKNNGKVDYNRVAKKILLKNIKVLRVDGVSFKLESVFANQILSCKDKEEADRWMYQLQQRIFDNSSKIQMFNMMQEEDAVDEPIIFIAYDSHINMQVNKLEIIYEKNTKEKILGVGLRRLVVGLKENNLQFERKVDLQQLAITNLSLQNEVSEEFRLILSNTYNYFQDPNEDEQYTANIQILLQGKKKTHPKYTGQITIKGKFNRLFVNFNTEFIFSILYRLVVGDAKQEYYTEQAKNAKILEILKEILLQENGIDQRYQNAKNFQFHRSYVELEQYKSIYACSVLFHVELKCQEVEVYLVNGRDLHWMDKFTAEGIAVNIDKSTDFLFVKGAATTICLADITGYPKTSRKPLEILEPYPIIKALPQRKHKKMVQFAAGIFQPMSFINKQRFKNYFMLSLSDAEINYQQQPLLRFVDFLTNQIILFILQPFSLHKFDTPQRGPFNFGPINFTQPQIRKILYQSVYPCFTHLNISAYNLKVNFNSHPHDQAIPLQITRVAFVSAPEVNSQRIHVRLDQLRRFQNKYPILKELVQAGNFERKVSKWQWITRYLINVEGCRCPIIQNEFNYEMYFQRSNNGDKDILLPFLSIQKDLLMQGRIKNLSIHAPRDIYNLINKCFLFNLSYDDQADILFNANYQYNHLNDPSKLIYRLLVHELSIVIPEIHQTVIIIQECEYKFIRCQDGRKEMEVNGRNLHILGAEKNLITPLSLQDQSQLGLQYAITMKPSGQKRMSAFIRYIDFHYYQDIILPLFKYFLLDESCYPKQDVYADIPLIICEVCLFDSYIKLAQSSDFVYSLKGNIRVIWSRYQQPHPQNYRQNKALYPKDKDGSAYDIEFKGVTLRKYSKKAYQNLSTISIKQANFYRSLSSSIVFSLTLTNIMRISNEATYTDMVGNYHIDSLCLKLSYKDYQEIANAFKSEHEPQPPQPVVNAQLPYMPHSKHKASINKLSLQFGLSQLPVPLLDVCLERSQIDVELIGRTKVFTSKVELIINYWNMMIGRWQPLLERSGLELTMKAGQFQKYLMATSSKAMLLNFSVQALKVLTLVSRDVSQSGNLHVINKEERAKGIQISPYVITNRTGFSIIIHSDFTLTAKIKNNQKMHLQHKSAEVAENLSSINYQIQGDSTLYNLNLNLNQTIRPSITFNENKYRLIVSAIATPVLKEIIISSPYVIHNRTHHPFILTIGSRDYIVQPDSKVPIPFIEDMVDNKQIGLEFPHLQHVSENYNFELRDIMKGYEHYIIYEQGKTFNCLISVKSNDQNLITISPLVSLTNLLPLKLLMQMAVGKTSREKALIKQQVQVNVQKEFYEFGSKDEVQLRIHICGFNYSQFTSLDLTNSREHNEIALSLPINDGRGLQASINIKIIKKSKQKHIYVYTDSVLLNETDKILFVFNDSQLLAGQRLKDIPESYSKYVMLGGVDEPALCFSQQDPSQARRFKTRQLGDQAISLSNHYQLHEFVINNSLSCLCEQAQIFTSLVKVAPRFILVNKCTRPLAFQQYNTDQQFYLLVGERKDWYWHHNQETCLITVTAREGQIGLDDDWDFSAPFSLETMEETVLVIRPKGRSDSRLLMKTEVIKQSQQIFISFKELLQKEDSLIRIQNNLKLVNLQIQQQALEHSNSPWSPYRHFACPSLKEIDFGWDFLEEQKRLLITFNFVGPYRSRYNSDNMVITLDNFREPIIKEFRDDNDERLEIDIYVEIVGMRKTIVFRNRDESQASQCDDDLMLSMSGNKMGVSLAEIGISIIGGQGRRSELIFMSVRKLDLIMTEKQQKRNFELRIKYMNIDNNLNHNTVYPVLFTPLKYHKTLDKNRPFFICLIEQNLKTKQLNEINYFRLCVEPISFKIYDEMITHLYNFSNALASLSEKEEKLNVALLFRSNQPEFQWQVRSIVKQGASIFFRQVQIGKVIVQLSFSMRPTFKGNIILHTMLALFGSAFTNVSESQMRLNRFLRKDLSLGELKGQIGGFYQKEVMKEMYKIAGAINLFGNPYVFVKYLAQGTWEIVNQPSQGFIKGPIQGALGVGKGGVYFLRNVIAATFNSFQAVSQSCSRGLAYITFDQKFITRRDKIQMQKSKHIGQGAKSALWALFTGFEVAISGVVRQPRQEGRKSGTAGVFKGLMLGLTGLVTKPMSGIFQAISKFSEGVKRTALFFQDGPNSTRSRPPRVFISSQEYYSQYSLEQSKAINLLQFHSTKHLDKTILLVAVDQHFDDWTYTVVTSEYLVQLSRSDKKIIRQIKLADITEVQPQEQGGRRGVRVKFNEDEVLILTHKHRELYECFKEIFVKIQEEIQEQEDEEYED